MEKEQIIQYLILNEKARYEAEKEKQKTLTAILETLRYIVISLVIGATIGFCFHTYFGKPAKTSEIEITGDSSAAIGNILDNGSELWQ